VEKRLDTGRPPHHVEPGSAHGVHVEDLLSLAETKRDAGWVPGIETQRGGALAPDQLVEKLAVAGHVLGAGGRRVDEELPDRGRPDARGSRVTSRRYRGLRR